MLRQASCSLARARELLCNSMSKTLLPGITRMLTLTLSKAIMSLIRVNIPSVSGILPTVIFRKKSLQRMPSMNISSTLMPMSISIWMTSLETAFRISSRPIMESTKARRTERLGTILSVLPIGGQREKLVIQKS